MYNGLYENIVKDYVTDVYTDVIEGYSIATIKVGALRRSGASSSALWMVLRRLDADTQRHLPQLHGKYGQELPGWGRGARG
jgi:hypothetical protein